MLKRFIFFVLLFAFAITSLGSIPSAYGTEAELVILGAVYGPSMKFSSTAPTIIYGETGERRHFSGDNTAELSFGIGFRTVSSFGFSTEASYNQRMAKTFADHKALADVFTQLAQDEAEHGSEFTELLNQLPADEGAGDSEALRMVQAAGLTGEMDAENLEKPEGIQSPKDALAKALAFERSTLFYYQSLQEALGESPQLMAMIKAEKGHVLTLMKIILTEGEFRGLGDKW